MGKQPKSKFTNDDLKVMQSWDLDRKIATSLTRIAEFYAKYPHKIYVLSVVRYNIQCIYYIAILYIVLLIPRNNVHNRPDNTLHNIPQNNTLQNQP